MKHVKNFFKMLASCNLSDCSVIAFSDCCWNLSSPQTNIRASVPSVLRLLFNRMDAIL